MMFYYVKGTTKKTEIWNTNEKNIFYDLHSKAPRLCIRTHIFNNMKVLNQFEKCVRGLSWFYIGSFVNWPIIKCIGKFVHKIESP